MTDFEAQYEKAMIEAKVVWRSLDPSQRMLACRGMPTKEHIALAAQEIKRVTSDKLRERRHRLHPHLHFKD